MLDERAEKGKFVLVFDGIDKQRETPPTLLPALARVGEIVSSNLARHCQIIFLRME